MRFRLSLILATIVILSIVIIPIANSDTSTLAIGPKNINITVNSGQSVQQDFTVMCHTGLLKIEVVGIPASVSPNQIDISSLSQVISLTITANQETSGVYNGYIKFSKVNTEVTSLAISIAVNIKITANVIGSSISYGTPDIVITSTPKPTMSPIASPTPLPTTTVTTPTPTPTPKPTETPKPTQTPIPSPTTVPTTSPSPTVSPEQPGETPLVIGSTNNDSGTNIWIIIFIILVLAVAAILFYLIFVSKIIEVK